VAALAVTPAEAVEGEPVRLDASASEGAIATYRWDLDGDGTFETDGGTQPVLEHAFEPGSLTVAVQVEDAAGATDHASAGLTVIESAPAPASAAEPAPAPKPKRVKKGAPAPPESKLTAAASTSVAIENFAFSPATVNVDVGDTVTWTNGDSAPHTATGDGFDTGNLDEGESGSATFSTAGSFSYICSLHPQMKGTVVVAGADPGGSSPESPSSSSSSSSPSSSSLPQTGSEPATIVLLGLLMIATGGVLRLASPRG
jgi:LPXTG-motif cell wall-anchored protein